LLRFVRAVEREPSLLGLGPHLLAVAHRPRSSGSAARGGRRPRPGAGRAGRARKRPSARGKT
jgi:hypothetical protein